VDEQYVFFPPHRRGVIFHLSSITILTLVGAWGLWNAFRVDLGSTFFLYLLPFMIALPLVPLLIYRLGSLENASYTLERESIRLRWGWRIELIPMPHVQWVRTAADLGRSLPRPRLRWPGAVYGTRRYPGGRMDIEYLASTTKGLLVIATTEKLYAISPANADNFLMTYQHFTEMGSLLAPPASSVYPTNLIARLWGTRPARNLVLVGAILSLALLVWVSIAISNVEYVSLGVTPTGEPRMPIPSIQLTLLPVLNYFAYMVDLLLGFVFFRRAETQHLAYLMWGTSIFVSILFFVAVIFIL
jgi:hypothetical protein